MFYRRKIILSLLQLLNGQTDKLKLQKLLFLYCQHSLQKTFDFVPYKYGCYSFTANSDVQALIHKGLLIENENTLIKKDENNYLNQIHKEDLQILQKITNEFGHLTPKSLIQYIYTHYPYYAIKSEIADEILNHSSIQKIKQSVPVNHKIALYTIGYEGISLEEYLNRLIHNDIKLLIDVRNNPISMKFGFNKNQLNYYCKSLGIEYTHIPELGIESQHRKQLITQNDYDQLFLNYRKSTLKEKKEQQYQILLLLQKYQRVALTCFEADICQCHRKHLAESLLSMAHFKFELIHI